MHNHPHFPARGEFGADGDANDTWILILVVAHRIRGLLMCGWLWRGVGVGRVSECGLCVGLWHCGVSSKHTLVLQELSLLLLLLLLMPPPLLGLLFTIVMLSPPPFFLRSTGAFRWFR